VSGPPTAPRIATNGPCDTSTLVCALDPERARRASVCSGGGMLCPCFRARRGLVPSGFETGSCKVPDLTLICHQRLTGTCIVA
jgi:hypothetical protein